MIYMMTSSSLQRPRSIIMVVVVEAKTANNKQTTINTATFLNVESERKGPWTSNVCYGVLSVCWRVFSSGFLAYQMWSDQSQQSFLLTASLLVTTSIAIVLNLWHTHKFL
eukprot:PhF_6_TR25529/c0_g1_i7/m.35740